MSGYELTARRKECPGCGRPSQTDAVICTKCGRNFETGQRAREAERDPHDAQRKAELLKKARSGGGVEIAAAVSAGAMPDPAVACPNCGYDLKGLGSRPCPECGQTALGRRRGGIRGDSEERRQVEIDRYWRNSWLIAGIGLAVGVISAVLVAPHVSSMSMADGIVSLGMCEVILIGTCLGMSWAFVGFEEDVRGLIVRLVGVAGIWWALMPLAGLLLVFNIFGLAMAAVLCVTLLAVPLHTLTGRDWDDSYWIAAPTWFIFIIARMIVPSF